MNKSTRRRLGYAVLLSGFAGALFLFSDSRRHSVGFDLNPIRFATCAQSLDLSIVRAGDVYYALNAQLFGPRIPLWEVQLKRGSYTLKSALRCRDGSSRNETRTIHVQQDGIVPFKLSSVCGCASGSE